MANYINKLLKLFIPPIFFKLLSSKNKKILQFTKTNLSWDEVLKVIPSDYSAENILTKCRDSLLKVKNGEYPYERDSVLFTEKIIFYPLLSSLLYIAIKNNYNLNIIDYGGSLGSTYFQNIEILRNAGITINWNIIEQKNFVTCGKKYFTENNLDFFYNISEIPNMERINTFLFSSVLQYLKDPYQIMDSIKKYEITYLIIDRTIFIEDEPNDILTFQKVPDEIYKASYPAWFLSLNKFIHYIEKDYEILLKWNSLDQHSLINYKTIGLGFLLQKKVSISKNAKNI